MFTLILDETLKEMTVHGSRAFPFAIYMGGVTRFEKGYLDWHWHDYFEINLVVSGTLHYYIENKEYILREGEAIFINSGRLHRGYSEDLVQVSNTIVFSGELFCGDASSEWYTVMIEEFVCSDLNGLVLNENNSWMKNVLCNLKTVYQEYIRHSYGYELAIKGNMCSVFLEILRNTVHDTKPTSNETEKMKRMRLLLSFIAQNYTNNITLSDIANAAGLSEAECSRFFSYHMKQTMFSYLNQYRIERSCELLAQTDMSISDIAMQTGFNSFSYYGKRFREIMHCTPSEYRQKIQRALSEEGVNFG